MGKTIVAISLLVLIATGCGGGRSSAGPGPSTTVPQFSGDSNSAWCGYANQMDDTNQLNATFTKDPGAWVAQITGLMGKAEASAPAAIQADVATMAGAVRGLAQALTGAHDDFSKLSPEQLAALQGPRFVAAGARVRAYDQQVCRTPN